MGEKLFGGYVTAGLCALAVYFMLPSDDLRELVWQLFIWCGVVAIALGVRVHRPSLRGPWWVLAAGLCLLALAGTINLPWWPTGSEMSRRIVGDLMMLVGYPLIGVGALRMARAQSDGRDNGPVLDSLVVTIALTTVLWEAVFARHGTSGMETSSFVSLLVLSLSASWVAAMSSRLILSGGHRITSAWLLVAASVSAVVATVAFLWDGGQGRLITGGPIDALWGVAVLLVAACATHRSMRGLTEPQEDIEVAHTWARMLLPAIALMTPPMAILVRQATTGETAVVAAGASVLIAGVVILRFADLVRGRERAREESIHQSLHDPLTGLANRMLLEQRLEHALGRRRRPEATVAVAFVDLDGFKAINDTFGHAAGDELLRCAARRMTAVVRSSDTVCRFAGDEFVLVFEDVDAATAGVLAERLLAELRLPVRVGGQVLAVSASIGLALVAPEVTDPEVPLRQADAAMYRAKDLGRDRVECPAVPAAGAGEAEGRAGAASPSSTAR